MVKDSDSVALWQLPGGLPPPPPPPGAPPSLVTAPAPPVFAPATPAELFLRRLDPELRRFVASYGRRRFELPPDLRAQLADQLQPNLQAAVPDVYSQYGPLAALDYLADLEHAPAQ